MEKAIKTLVDSSVWIDHFKRSIPELSRLVEDREVLTHPFVIGELALGHLGNRAAILADFAEIEQAPRVEDREVMHLIERHHLHGVGIGLVDCHLIASALLAHANLLTHDSSLKRAWLKIKN